MSQNQEPKERKPPRTWTRTPPPEHTPTTAEWVQIARQLLVSEGIAEVKVDRMAKIAGVTRGGFYWRFKNREELTDALLDDWTSANTDPTLAILRGPGRPRDRLQALASMQIEEEVYSSAYDMAMRNWARSSTKVAEVVRQVDQRRIKAFLELFLEAGYKMPEAEVRARVTYFQQVGYYAVGIPQPKAARRRLAEIYVKVLAGAKADDAI